MSPTRKTVYSSPRNYEPHEIRSHPFRFIDFPVYLSGLTSFYWIVLCPFLYGFFADQFEAFPSWAPFYLLLAFVLYLVMLAILVFVWRHKPRKHTSYGYQARSEIDSDIEAPSSVSKTAQSDPRVFLEREAPEHGAKEKPAPFRIPLYASRPISQNLSSPLTPRELFLFDLIETALKTDRDASRRFIEAERADCLEEWRPFGSGEEDEDEGEEKQREFFIANAEVQKACVAQAFLFVEDSVADTDRCFELVASVD